MRIRHLARLREWDPEATRPDAPPSARTLTGAPSGVSCGTRIARMVDHETITEK